MCVCLLLAVMWGRRLEDEETLKDWSRFVLTYKNKKGKEWLPKRLTARNWINSTLLLLLDLIRTMSRASRALEHWWTVEKRGAGFFPSWVVLSEVCIPELPFVHSDFSRFKKMDQILDSVFKLQFDATPKKNLQNCHSYNHHH